MKIAIDVSRLHPLHRKRGIGIYALKLAQTLPHIDREHHYRLAQTASDLQGVDLIHVPFFDLFFLTLPLGKKTKRVVTVHDVIPLVFPDQFRPGLRGKVKFQIQKTALKKTDAIITDSQNSKKDIIHYLGMPEDKIHVVYLGVDKQFHPLNIEKQSFVLYVGDVNANKNLPALLEAFGSLGRRDLKLILAGRVWGQSIPEVASLKKLVDRLRISSQVEYVPKPNLKRLYNQARLYVQPSLYEGFGLPVLEAMACGTPVVATHVASLPEICGQAAMIVEPTPSGLARGIQNVLNRSPKERETYRTRGLVQAARFSWEQTARETVKVYNQVLAK